MMKREVEAAVKFISKLVSQNSSYKEQDLLQFTDDLERYLIEKFRNHWHPERPWQGQAYRCLRINERIGREPTIDKAAQASGLIYSKLKLPIEMTIWVDPNEVCGRFGEQKGSSFTIASFHSDSQQFQLEELDLTRILQQDIIDEEEKTLRNVSPVHNSSHSSPEQNVNKENVPPLKKAFKKNGQPNPKHSLYNRRVLLDRNSVGHLQKSYLNSHYMRHSPYGHVTHTPAYYSSLYKTSPWIGVGPHPNSVNSSGYFYSSGHQNQAGSRPVSTRNLYITSSTSQYLQPNSYAQYFPPSCSVGSPTKYKWNSVHGKGGSLYQKYNNNQWLSHSPLA